MTSYLNIFLKFLKIRKIHDVNKEVFIKAEFVSAIKISSFQKNMFHNINYAVLIHPTNFLI